MIPNAIGSGILLLGIGGFEADVGDDVVELPGPCLIVGRNMAGIIVIGSGGGGARDVAICQCA